MKGVRRIGVRIGNWLTAEQAKRLLTVAERGSLRGKRVYSRIAMLIGCGLRRGELLALRVDSIQLREEHWVVADLLGKAGRLALQTDRSEIRLWFSETRSERPASG